MSNATISNGTIGNLNVLQTRLQRIDHARLLALAVEMGERAGGLEVSRAEVFRLCVLRGLAAYEQDFGMVPKPKAKARKR
jgi:hypothetical protein